MRILQGLGVPHSKPYACRGQDKNVRLYFDNARGLPTGSADLVVRARIKVTSLEQVEPPGSFL